MSYHLAIRDLARKIKAGRRKQMVELATISDTSPYANYGYVIARLVDETPINVRTWTGLQLGAGQEIMVVRIGEEAWNWYALIGVNGSTTSTEDGGTPFTPPATHPDTIGPHALGGALHTGGLPWARIDLSGGKVDLAGDVEGILPRAFQENQVQKLTVTQDVSAAGGATVTGSIAACSSGLVRAVTLTGGVQATLRFLVEPTGDEEYATTSVSTPFTDTALPFFHEDALRDGQLYYELTNDGVDPETFTLAVVVMAMG